MDTGEYLKTAVQPYRIVNDTAQALLRGFSARLTGFDTAESIFEADLSLPLGTVDFSIDIRKERGRAREAAEKAAGESGSSAWRNTAALFALWADSATATHTKVEDIWLEFDYAASQDRCADPCVFIDARQATRENHLWIYNEPLAALLGEAPSKPLRSSLSGCIGALPQGKGLFQLGVMLARQFTEQRVRVFTDEADARSLMTYLKRIEAPTCPPEDIFALMSRWSDGKYIADFDVCEAGVMTKLGINFGLASYTPPVMSEFLGMLCSGGMAMRESCAPLTEWHNFARDISHFKLVFDPPYPVRAKVYLREWPVDRLSGVARW